MRRLGVGSVYAIDCTLDLGGVMVDGELNLVRGRFVVGAKAQAPIKVVAEPTTTVGPFLISSSLLNDPTVRPSDLRADETRLEAEERYAVPLVFHEQVAAEIEERSQRKGRRRHRG